MPAEAHDTELTAALPPLFSPPVPGTSIAARKVAARGAAPAAALATPAGAAQPVASGAAHHSAAAAARTITTLCRRIGSPQHIPAGRARHQADRSGTATRTDTLVRQEWPEHKNGGTAQVSETVRPRGRCPLTGGCELGPGNVSHLTFGNREADNSTLRLAPVLPSLYTARLRRR